MLSRNVILYGRNESLPTSIPLRAGPCAVIFQDGDLRYFQVSGREVLRRVYTAVRDRNWGTVPGLLSNLKIDQQPRSFVITYQSEHRQGPIHFRWSTRIEGSESGEISFAAEGEALSTFLRNRIGICVLHPILECAGAACRVTHSDGRSEESSFPRFVAPHQPFLDMRAISHTVAPGFTADLQFEGDIFEMEDQRNWTDGSYKTYSTPLAIPFPVEVAQGSRVRQSIRLTFEGKPPAPKAGPTDRVRVRRSNGASQPLPALGFARSSTSPRLSIVQIGNLRRLQPAHLRADIDLSVSEFPANVMAAAAEATALTTRLELALHLSGKAEDQLQKLASHLRASKTPLARYLVFHREQKSTRGHFITLAQRQLHAVTPGIPVVTGTNAYFTELNRERPDPGADGVTFSLNPQVHAFDNDSLIENLTSQFDVLESIRQFAGRSPVFVNSISLRPRFNPNATGPETSPAPGDLPSSVDPRQISLFTAAWTLASFKYLTKGGAASATYFETAGWRGVLADEDPAGQPEPFRSLARGFFPVYFLFEDLAPFAKGQSLPVESAAPRQVEGMVIRQDNRVRAIVANLTNEEQKVSLEVADLGRQASAYYLDATNAETAMLAPAAWRAAKASLIQKKGEGFEILLSPYALVRLDGVKV